MNKTQLIDAIAAEAGWPKRTVADIMSAAVRVAEATLKAGNPVVLGDFGKFSTAQREAREARNPATGETVKVPAKTVVKFKVSKSLAEAIA